MLADFPSRCAREPLESRPELAAERLDRDRSEPGERDSAPAPSRSPSRAYRAESSAPRPAAEPPPQSSSVSEMGRSLCREAVIVREDVTQIVGSGVRIGGTGTGCMVRSGAVGQ